MISDERVIGRARIRRVSRVIGGVIAGVLACSVTVVSNASAINTYRYWYNDRNPLTVYDDGHAQGAGFGQWRVTHTSSGTKSVAFAYVKDYWPTGNYIYLEHQVQSNAGICSAPQYTSCNQPYYDGQKGSSSGSNSSEWTAQSVIVTPNLNANYARAKVRICEEQRWSPNPCSGWAVTLGDWF